MVELYQDEQDKEVLVYADDINTALQLRKVFKMFGAVYTGKEQGYSWRVTKKDAIKYLKLLGLQYILIACDDFKGLTAVQSAKFQLGRARSEKETQCPTSESKCA